MTKINRTMRIKPEILHYGKQLADHLNRNFTNLVEHLLVQEVQKAKADGFKFEKYIEPGGEVVGKGVDPNLKSEFSKFMKE